MNLRQSYVHSAGATPLVGETIGERFDRVVEEQGEHEALIVRHQGVRWSYRELGERVDDLAVGLLAVGLEPGDRVGIWAMNDAEWVVTQFATAKAGLVLVNINPAYRPAELEYALDITDCSALITADAFKTSDYIAMLRELLPELDGSAPGELHAARLPLLRTVIRLGGESTRGMLNYDDVTSMGGEAERGRIDRLQDELQFDDPINIQFTSGTTGTPKAATLTHHNILNNARFVADGMRLSAEDRLCIPVPMYHCFGMVMGALVAVASGATMVFPSRWFDPRAVLEAVEAERCTALHGVPTMFIEELDDAEFDRFDLSSLRTGVIAGAPCPVELMQRLVADMHLPEITIAYGMTETGPVSTQTAVDDPLEARVGTVGRVLPHTEIKIVDDEGRVVPVGETGELLTRGYCVMPGYWGAEELTRGTIDEAGWIRSGDLATLDADGYCRIVGRSKDMVIRGGENIYPREIEEFLFEHPAIEDVQIVGVRDEKLGEELCACVRLHEGAVASEEEIREFCRGHIAHFKIPRYVRFVDEFPMTITGKVQKFKLREQMEAELALAEGVPA